MKELLAFCGLDCEQCDAYIATANNYDALREKTAKAWSELYNSPIKPEHINCEGCRADGVKLIYCEKYCEIRQCALKKNMNNCGECQELEDCKTVGAIIENNPDALKNLKACATVHGQT